MAINVEGMWFSEIRLGSSCCTGLSFGELDF